MKIPFLLTQSVCCNMQHTKQDYVKNTLLGFWCYGRKSKYEHIVSSSIGMSFIKRIFTLCVMPGYTRIGKCTLWCNTQHTIHTLVSKMYFLYFDIAIDKSLSVIFHGTSFKGNAISFLMLSSHIMVGDKSCTRFHEEWSNWIGLISRLEYDSVVFFVPINAQHLPRPPDTMKWT